MARVSRRLRSTRRASSMAASPGLPDSKLGDAIGLNSTLKRTEPSLGLQEGPQWAAVMELAAAWAPHGNVQVAQQLADAAWWRLTAARGAAAGRLSNSMWLRKQLHPASGCMHTLGCVRLAGPKL